MKRKFVFLLLISICAACGRVQIGTQDPGISDSNMSGQINSTEWAYRSGEARVSITDSSKLEIILWDMAAHTACSEASYANERQAYFTFSPRTGSYTLNNSAGTFPGAGFSYTTENGEAAITATQGRLEIISISPTTVQGKAEFSKSSDSVSGAFSVKICR